MTVFAGFTRRHTPRPAPDLTALVLDRPAHLLTREAADGAHALLREAVEKAAAPDLTPHQRTAARRVVELREQALRFARADVERAIRAANPGAPEAAIQAATLAA